MAVRPLGIEVQPEILLHKEDAPFCHGWRASKQLRRHLRVLQDTKMGIRSWKGKFQALRLKNQCWGCPMSRKLGEK